MSCGPPASIETLRLRASMLARVRAFFAARGVLEVETPALSTAAVSDPALASIGADVRSLGGASYLHTSPEFAMKRLIAAGSGDIYQVCRVFRDDELGRWHQPEFTMLEWYRVGWDETRLMDEVQDLVREALAGRARSWPAERLSYAEAFGRAVGVDPGRDAGVVADRLAALGIDVPQGLDDDMLLDLAFAAAVEPSFRRDALTFVCDYPASRAVLAKIKAGTPPAAARFELFAAGIELANGFAELTDAAEQRRRFEADLERRRRAGLPAAPLDEEFLAALERGLPECAGVALGFDRLVALAAGLPSVADAISFAHRPRAQQ